MSDQHQHASQVPAVSSNSKPGEPAPTVDSPWNDELLTTRGLMEFLGLSRTKIWELARKEGLPAFKEGGEYRYRRSEVLDWLEKYRVVRG